MVNESTANMWAGYVGDSDPTGIIQFKGIVKDDAMFVSSLRNYLLDYYEGISVLEKSGTLARYWDDIEHEIIRRGKIALVKFGESGEKFLADVITDERNILKGITRTTLSLIDNPDTKFTNDPALLSQGKIGTGANGSITKKDLPNHYLKLEPQDFVIFKNNREGSPYLANFEYYAQKLVNVIRKMELDMFMSEKKLMFIVDEQPEEEDVAYLMATFTRGVFVFPNFQYSRDPSKASQKEGKVGINPHNVKFELYEPKTDFTDRYLKKFEFWWNKLMLVSGVRHDVLENKEERATSGEVRASGRTFDAFEKRGWKARMLGISDYKSKFDSEGAVYQLVYGDYNKEGNRNF